MHQAEREAMFAAEERHWWYRGRRRIVRAELERLAPRPRGRVLDAGCGSGRMLDELARFGRPFGVDIDAGSVERARTRGHQALLASVSAMPFDDGMFSITTCLDVVEHLDDDRAALREMLRVTEPGGALVVTVPAYQALWSKHDEANQHRRRYGSASLAAAAIDAGWTVERSTYFNAVLLPPAAVVRLLERRRRRPAEFSDLQITPAGLDPVLELPMRLEAALLRRGARLPAGLSLLAVLRREAAVTARPEGVEHRIAVTA
jgi:SAM-dependent methyltransferase